MKKLIILAVFLSGCGHAVETAEPPAECQELLAEKLEAQLTVCREAGGCE